MSLRSIRRALLKPLALMLTAMLCLGIFSACTSADENNPVLKKAGELTVLQVTAGMGEKKDDKYITPDASGKEIVFPMLITNGRKNPITITPSNFKVTVYKTEGDKSVAVKKYTSSLLTIDPSLLDTNLKQNDTSKGSIKVNLDAPLAAGQYIVLTYCPDLQYNEYSMSWRLEGPAANAKT